MKDLTRPAAAFWLTLMIVVSSTAVSNYLAVRRLTERASIIHQDLAKQVQEHRLQQKQLEDRIMKRLEDVERTIYVDIEAELANKKRPITVTEAWVRQRDAEFRQRLTALEEWRLRHGGE